MSSEGTPTQSVESVPLTEKVSRRQLTRAVVASSVGTSIEWFDFFLYGAASALVFGPLFFPSHDPATGLLLAFATFFVGFASRPLGAALFGHFGDRVGRKAALIASLFLMGLGTFCVGLIPTYEQIGPFAGVLLVVMRAIQGIGVGGEWGGAVLLTMEWGAKTGRRGFLTSWPQVGVPVGTILSNGAMITTIVLTGDNFLTWGWRIPFLASIVLIGVGLYIRLGILESPTFGRIVAERRTAAAPVREVLRTNWRRVVLTCLLRTGQQAPAFVFLTFFLSYATTELDFEQRTVLYIVMIASMFSLVTMPVSGHLSDRLGRRRVYVFGAAATMVWAFLYFPLLDTGSLWLVFLASAVALFFHDIQYGTQAAFTAEAFPTRLRYSGASLGYHFASITAGGPAPFIAAWLLVVFGTPFAIGVYMALCAVVSIIAAFLLPDRAHADITE